MTAGKPLEAAKLKPLILKILDEHRTMAVATVRPDGWPQATIVGYVHDDLTLYFVVSRESQKLANLKRDPRASVAIGHAQPGEESARGLSLATRVEEIEAVHEIERLNALVQARYPEVAVFAPRHVSCAVLRAQPLFVSLVDEAEGLDQPVLFKVSDQGELNFAAADPPGATPGGRG